MHLRLLLSSSESSIPDGTSNFAVRSKQCSLITLVLSCAVAAGVQFGLALQLSLLTPYIQTLGIQHAFSSFIWLCGPITGLVVIIIGFSADIGYILDDTKEHCSTFRGT